MTDSPAPLDSLKPLHEVGTERDKAGNRDLHMDQYCLLVLMWLYNPVIDSLRGLQQAYPRARVHAVDIAHPMLMQAGANYRWLSRKRRVVADIEQNDRPVAIRL